MVGFVFQLTRPIGGQSFDGGKPLVESRVPQRKMKMRYMKWSSKDRGSGCTSVTCQGMGLGHYR